MSHGRGGDRKVKKCHVLFEWTNLTSDKKENLPSQTYFQITYLQVTSFLGDPL